MSSLLSAELSATCNALGTYDKRTGKYLVDEFTLNTVKDLIRYLRRDGEDHEIRRHFGQTKVLQSDLILLLIDHWENDELFDVTLRLLVNLTNPALLLYREEVPTERTARHNYLQILSHLQSYKEEAFTKVNTWNVFAKKLTKVLETDWNERDEDTGLVIERILILIRNIVHVPADGDREKRPENDASVHDQVLWALNQSGILDIILYMSSENEKQYFMHILEIISHLLREQNPTSLADAALQRSVDEKLRDEQELLSIRMNETNQRNNKVRQFSASRHSRFGGTYVVQNMKSISENELICLKPPNKISNLDFGGSKKEKFLKPKNRRPIETENIERRSAFAVRLFLKEFCIEFLNSSYNALMHYVKDVLVRAKAQQNDESYYLWALKFFMEFNRGYNFQVGLVSETMSVPMFHYVQQQMEKYFDMIKVEKKKFLVWVRRLHLGLRAYKELLNTLLAMDKSNDVSVKDSAKVLKSNIFYILEYREFMLTTFLSYDEGKMPRSYLVDLVETAHLYLKMLEHFCKKTGLVVQKKVRKANRKTKSAGGRSRVAPLARPEPPAWEELRGQMAAVISTGFETHQVPFDAASDTPIDQQREGCMKNVQRLMREYKFEESIGLFRAAREVWPEEGIFGVSGMPEDEELTMLETIYEADLGEDFPDSLGNSKAEPQGDTDEDGGDDEDEEGEVQSATIVESSFDFADFGERFCHPRVVSACAYLLEGFENNLPHTNHCIIKLLHRIAWDSSHPTMMFQATLFLTFQKILDVRSARFKELEKFAVFVLRKFVESAAKDPKIYIELLFWKSMRDAREIELGYEIYGDSKPGKGVWSEEQDEELTNLYMENQRNPATDKDVIDWIMENLIDQTRTRRTIIKKLKELGLIFRAPTKKSNVREAVSVEFTQEEDEMLKALWSQFGDTIDPMGAIVGRMPQKRPKHRFIDRLLELNIINDKKQCHKKRTIKSDGAKASNFSDRSDSESDDSRVNSSPPGKILQKHKKNNAKTKKLTKKQREFSGTEIAKVLVEAVDNDFSEALKWVAENLEEVALDQEAEGFDPSAEGVPLVPITSEAANAMENPNFQKVLYAIGVEPPSDEQESYWRIPSTVSFETLRKRKEIIIKAVDKTLIVENDSNTRDNRPITKQIIESSDDEDLFENLRKIRAVITVDPAIDKAIGKSVYRKRRRSLSGDKEISGKALKIGKIVEEINSESENDDILSFAKKTLPGTELLDTEDILGHAAIEDSFDSDDGVRPKRRVLDDSEDELQGKPARKVSRRNVIEDDSD